MSGDGGRVIAALHSSPMGVVVVEKDEGSVVFVAFHSFPFSDMKALNTQTVRLILMSQAWKTDHCVLMCVSPHLNDPDVEQSKWWMPAELSDCILGFSHKFLSSQRFKKQPVVMF